MLIKLKKQTNHPANVLMGQQHPDRIHHRQPISVADAFDLEEREREKREEEMRQDDELIKALDSARSPVTDLGDLKRPLLLIIEEEKEQVILTLAQRHNVPKESIPRLREDLSRIDLRVLIQAMA